MKRFFSILAVVAFTFALTSCGSDDDNKAPSIPEGTPKSIKDNKSVLFEILASKGSDFNPKETIELKDFPKFKEIEKLKEIDFAKYVKTAKFDQDNSYIKISGIKEDKVALKTLTLIVEGTKIQHTINNVKNGIFKDYDTDLKFLNKVVKRLADKKSISLKLQGTAEEEINKDIKVEVKISGEFMR